MFSSNAAGVLEHSGFCLWGGFWATKSTKETRRAERCVLSASLVFFVTYFITVTFFPSILKCTPPVSSRALNTLAALISLGMLPRKIFVGLLS